MQLKGEKEQECLNTQQQPVALATGHVVLATRKTVIIPAKKEDKLSSLFPRA